VKGESDILVVFLFEKRLS